jgi:hypothetical protein
MERRADPPPARRRSGVFAYIPHALRDDALMLGWLWSARLPSPHGAYSDLWEYRCCCGRPAFHPRTRTRVP